MLIAGTYSRRGSEGLYELSFDAATGKLALVRVMASLRNPSFQALHPTGQWVYSVCEESAAPAVAAVALEDGGAILGHQSTNGAGPCHVSVDPRGEWAAAANYGSGSVTLFPINPDGSLAPAADVVQHSGSGPVEARQQGPHAHSANFDASGRFVIAADLGIDRLMVYLLDRAPGKLRLQAEVEVDPGAGPRHFTFHPGGEWAYLITELANTIVGYRWDARNGNLQAVQTVSTLPGDFTGESYCADLHVHPSGRFLYGSNRGHDSLAIFGVEADGRLNALGHVPTGGEHPRNFALTPDAQWLLVANQDSDNIVVFRVDSQSGGLEQVGHPFGLPAPVCLTFR